jgi:class 3 adenylate cyclase
MRAAIRTTYGGPDVVRFEEVPDPVAGPGEVVVSWATRELLASSPIGFADRGLHELKGLSEPRRVYLVVDADRS